MFRRLSVSLVRSVVLAALLVVMGNSAQAAHEPAHPQSTGVHRFQPQAPWQRAIDGTGFPAGALGVAVAPPADCRHWLAGLAAA